MNQYTLKQKYWGYSDCSEEEGGIYLTIIDYYNKEVWSSFWINTKDLSNEKYLNELRDDVIKACHNIKINCDVKDKDTSKWKIIEDNSLDNL